MSGKDRLEAYLRDHGVPFQVQHHPRVYTAQEVAASEHIPGKLLAKVVLGVADGKPALFVVAASDRVDLAQAAALAGAREVRLASEQECSAAMPDCEVGAMPPFGNLYGLPVYVDTTLAQDETIFCQAGTHTDTLSLRYADFARLVQPVVGSFAQRR